MFLCREEELSKLNKRYAGDRFECVVIYGRRRVGKTALINKFREDKPTIFFSALNSTALDNLEALSKVIYNYEHPESMDSPVYHSFDAAFEAISRIGREERIVFVIDEYPYLAKADLSISSRLQHLMDHVWNDSHIFLILCGSSMSFMENQVLGYESPLYGRRTAQFKVEALSYLDSAKFYPNLSLEDNALIYGITGGIPHYLNKLDVKGDLDTAILMNIMDRSAYLYEEPENLLKQELREPALYNAIIKAVAGGASRQNEIALKSGLTSALCAKYLNVLMELGIISKETPISEKPGKKTVYHVSDNFFRFWYRYVANNIAAIASGRINRIYANAIKPSYSDYMGLIFEKMCKEYLLFYAERLPVEIKSVGQWWGTDPKARKEIQIDIVAPSSDENEYIIGSCKFRNAKTDLDEYWLLRDYASVFAKGKQCYFYIFSKSGFTEELLKEAKRGEVKLLSLNDLYSAPALLTSQPLML